MKKLRGYIFSRPFFSERVPQHIQNIVINNYCEKNNFYYLLSNVEYTMKNSCLMLNSTLKNLKNIDGIAFYSFFQMPSNITDRIIVYNKILKEKKEIHFATEKMIFNNKKQIDIFEDIINIKKLSENSDQISEKIYKFLNEK
jgi:sporadic carbohydrate cluster protein (TIGR04323 family)